MKIFTVVMVALSLYGCMGDMYHGVGGALQPKVFENGSGFVYAGPAGVPSYAKGMDEIEWHRSQISNQLGNQRICLNGYEITNTMHSGNDIVIEGICK